MSSIKVGIFDSGVGGLSIARAVKALNPDYQLHYVSDAAHHPYGGMSEAELLKRCESISAFLIEQGCDVVVVACNTATVNTITSLRNQFAAKFVGVEPGIKPAALISGDAIAIWATQNTLKSQQYLHLKQTYGDGHQVSDIACIGLADEIERVTSESAFEPDLLLPFITQTKASRCDTLVLGCTHYGLIKPAIMAHWKDGTLNLVDTSDAVAKQVSRVAGESACSQIPQDCFYTSGSIEYFRQQIQCWWPENEGCIKHQTL